ncbi:unnamed protein product [Hymenolepis diminuta]|uniref:Uncharacterized protein n=1 Tax=Hymenolepis diminuta TaxID=6216 RepID=A0A564YXM3_HYMDI|nr:unnamed protein product [Hymenolepis diminuta]
MNFSEPNKDSEDYVKNVGEFHYELSVDKASVPCYARNRDVYKDRMTGLTDEKMTFAKEIHKCEGYGDNTSHFNKCYMCLNLATYEGKDIHKYTGISRHSSCYAEFSLKLLSVLGKNPDVVLHNLVDKCNNFRSLIGNSNTVKSNETRSIIIKKSEIG